MASKKILVQLDIQAASSLTSPLSGFVGFSAKADGLYQKIGTSPELRLLTSADVQNAILADGSITGAVSQAQTFTLGVKLSNLTQGYVPYASGATKLLSNSPIYTDGTNVGIGTTTPMAKLETYNPNGGFVRALRLSSNASAAEDGVYMQFNSASTPTSNDGYGPYIGSRRVVGGDGHLVFGTNLGTAIHERMRITSTGNVGIGTTNPGAYKLNVNGNTNITGNLNISGLTASKVVFTDASKNLTSTGIGTASQFIKGDGSLDSNTYITTGTTIITGSGVDSRLTFWSGTNSLSSSSSLGWNDTTKNLGVTGGIVANSVSASISVSTNSLSTNGFRLIATTTAGYVLTADANGNGTWKAPGGSITGSGVSGRITFWNGTNSLSSTSDLEWNSTTKNLGVTGGVVANGISSISVSTNSLLTNTFRLIDTTTAGYVLTTDADGNGTWQAPTGSLSGFVPYTGANDNVNLGTHNLSCNEISATSTLTVGNTNSSSYTDGGYLSVQTPSANYANFDFYSKDTYDEFGVVEIIANPEEGIVLSARTNDNSSNSHVNVRYWELGFYTNLQKRLSIAQSGSINAFGNTITSTGGFIGNASTATKLQTARTITIGNQSLSFDGTANLTYSLANIGVPTGSGSNSRITFWNGTNSLSSSAYLTWDDTNNRINTNFINLMYGFKLGSLTTAGYVLTTDANGNGTWQAPPTGGGLYTDARYNTAGGIRAGLHLLIDAERNTFLGYEAGRENTTGSHNTFLGYEAGLANTSGEDNTAIGSVSLANNTSGYQNTAIGKASLISNLTGYDNTAIGNNSLVANTTGSQNTADGVSALYSNTTGISNTAIGVVSLLSNTTGSYNTVCGSRSLYSNITGYNNTALGYNSGSFLADGTTGRTTGNNGLYLGLNSKASANGTDNEIVIGSSAIGNGSNTITLGNDSIIKTILKGRLKLKTVPSVYADNSSAITGGLSAGEIYRTSIGVLMIVY